MKCVLFHVTVFLGTLFTICFCKSLPYLFYILFLITCCWQVVNQVLEGEGVGWLKLNRLKKLMEDESYRNFVVSKLNRTLDRKISPDDHIDDVVSILWASC